MGLGLVHYINVVFQPGQKARTPMEPLVVPMVLLALATFSILACVFGVDSRDFSDDQRRSPYPVGIS